MQTRKRPIRNVINVDRAWAPHVAMPCSCVSDPGPL
jgi:hypothetical protein